MQDEVIAIPSPHKRAPWNKGRLTGAKPPLRPKHVWSIRTKLQIEGRVRDLAMFNLAIDSKLRGCDVVAIRVEDVAASGYSRRSGKHKLVRGFAGPDPKQTQRRPYQVIRTPAEKTWLVLPPAISPS
jgi:hypothetical protein